MFRPVQHVPWCVPHPRTGAHDASDSHQILLPTAVDLTEGLVGVVRLSLTPPERLNFALRRHLAKLLGYGGCDKDKRHCSRRARDQMTHSYATEIGDHQWREAYHGGVPRSWLGAEISAETETALYSPQLIRETNLTRHTACDRFADNDILLTIWGSHSAREIMAGRTKP